jgi:hypothetical protein
MTGTSRGGPRASDGRANVSAIRMCRSSCPPIDFDALGDKAEALAMLRSVGWAAST